MIEEQLEEGTIHVEVPFKLIVKKAGETDPGKEIFKFMIDNFGVSTDYSIIKDTIETDGEKTYDGSFVFTIKERYADNLSDGFIIGLLKGSTEDWTYDETKFYAQPILSYSRDSVVGWKFCTLNENGTPDYENMVEEITFTNNYGDDKNDNNTYLVLWIVLACVSGSAIAGAIIIYKKRKLNAR